MAVARSRASGRLLPKGWPDFLLQLGLFALVDIVYEISRTFARGDLAEAFVHARDVVSVEKTLGIFNEMDVQHWAISKPWVLDIANLTYFHAHFAVTTLFMFWLYLRRNDHYYFVRNIVFSAMAIALIGYFLYPTAPPRMLTDLGFTDTLEKFASVNHDSGLVAALSNPFAAVPSVHTCFSLIIGVTCFFLVRRPGSAHHVAVLPLPDRVLDRRHRQPLLAGRDPGRPAGGSRAWDRMVDRAPPADTAPLRPPPAAPGTPPRAGCVGSPRT